MTRTGHLSDWAACESRGQLGAAVEDIGSLAGLGFNVFGNNREPLNLRKSRHGCALGLYAQARAALSISRDPNIRNHTACGYLRHPRRIPPFAVCMKRSTATCARDSMLQSRTRRGNIEIW